MTEFIGARISLISKRDIRYVGTLHEISSENSTVALERVVSYGTEGRRPDDEVPASLDNVYEYIVFRGSDVKDLRIEEAPKDNSAPKPNVPDDPAILGTQNARQSSPTQNPTQPNQAPQHAQQPSGVAPANQPQTQQRGPPGNFPQPNFPYGYSPDQRFNGPQGFPPGPYPFPPGPYGAPPGWYPPHGFPQMPPGQFPPHQMPLGAHGQPARGPMPSQQGPGVPTPSGSVAPPEDGQQFIKPEEKAIASAKLPGAFSNTPIPLQEAPSGPSPGGPRPDVKTEGLTGNLAPQKGTAADSKSSRIIPAIPLSSPQPKGVAPSHGDFKDSGTVAQITANMKTAAIGKSVEDANRDARAAVAAAMAKLPAAQGMKPQVEDSGLENLTKKVSEMRTTESVRTSRQPGTGGYASGNRGGRVPHRGNRHQSQRVEIPKTDYDFASANAKFNKQDLVKEAIASGSPITTPSGDTSDILDQGSSAASIGITRKSSDVSANPASITSYNRSTSFFDDISSEIKDRVESQETGQRLGGREFRNEERQKNMETFGQGSIDNAYRYRGRGRGRGRGGYGRGRGGRGGARGRGAATTTDV